MLLKILFWILVVCDLAAVGLFFVLGLAAAGSSRTSPLAVAGLLLIVPLLLLAGAVILFVSAKSPAIRGLAFVVAASPLLFVAFARVYGDVVMQMYQDKSGNATRFRGGAMQELEAAIARNDAAAVTAAAPHVNLKQKAIDGSGILVFALRELAKNPGPPEVLRALLQAGAKPNDPQPEMPLMVAIQVSSKTGPEPVRMLLDAGADPNSRGSFGDPAYYMATAKSVDLEVLRTLLDRGADLTIHKPDRTNALSQAAASQNWKAALLLLERGIAWRQLRNPMGLDFRSHLESDLRNYGDSGGLAEVIQFIQRADGSSNR